MVAEVENFPFSKKKLCSLSRMEPQRECDAPVASENSGDLKKDAVLDLYVVVGLFVHV